MINVEVKDKDAVMQDPAIKEATKEAEKLLEGNGRVLVRASGTEPLIRVLSETPEKELCQKADDIVIEALKPYQVKDNEE